MYTDWLFLCVIMALPEPRSLSWQVHSFNGLQWFHQLVASDGKESLDLQQQRHDAALQQIQGPRQSQGPTKEQQPNQIFQILGTSLFLPVSIGKRLSKGFVFASCRFKYDLIIYLIIVRKIIVGGCSSKSFQKRSLANTPS